MLMAMNPGIQAGDVERRRNNESTRFLNGQEKRHRPGREAAQTSDVGLPQMGSQEAVRRVGLRR